MLKHLIAFLFPLLFCTPLCALPVGNFADPSLPEIGVCDECRKESLLPLWLHDYSFRIGFSGDYVYNRHMRAQDGPVIEDFEIDTNAGLLGLTLFERFEAFVTLGASRVHVETPARSLVFPSATYLLEMESVTDFSYSVGASLIVYQCEDSLIGIDGKYFFSKLDIERMTLEGRLSVFPDAILEMRYWEWQIAAGASHKFLYFSPYTAVKYARAKAAYNLESVVIEGTPLFLNNWKAKRHWGWVLGLTYLPSCSVSLTAEARFCDEKALHVNGQIRF